MKPIKTPNSNSTFVLTGGTRDNDLPLQKTTIDGKSVLISTWELEDYEREAIAKGATIELIVWGRQTPPVALGIGEAVNNGI